MIKRALVTLSIALMCFTTIETLSGKVCTICCTGNICHSTCMGG